MKELPNLSFFHLHFLIISVGGLTFGNSYMIVSKVQYNIPINYIFLNLTIILIFSAISVALFTYIRNKYNINIKIVLVVLNISLLLLLL